MTTAERIKLELAKVRKWKLIGMGCGDPDAIEGPEIDVGKRHGVLEAAPVEALIAKMAKEIEVLRDTLKHYELTHFDDKGNRLRHSYNFASKALADGDKIWDERKGE